MSGGSLRLRAAAISAFHDARLIDAAPDGERLGVWHWIGQNHAYNTLLWDEEDKARRLDVPAAEVARSKRLIDGYNQKRNDAVEAIDECLIAELAGAQPQGRARLHSETPGAMIDRLSILSLKIFHMRLQTRREDVDVGHIAACTAKLRRLTEQRQDLQACLDAVLDEAAQGRTYFKVYRQFKMYNDPALNPWLYGAARQPAAGTSS